MSRNVTFIVLPEIQLLDLAGPADVFTTANKIAQSQGIRRAYRLTFVGPEVDPQTATGVGLNISPLNQAPSPIDTLIVPGGMAFGTSTFDPTAIRWIRKRWRRVRRVASICTGAFVLAEAGVLSGCRVTTHWRELGRLGQTVPDATIESDALYVKDGTVYTSAGITTGIDLALTLVEEDLGKQIALAVARALVMFLHRPGGQSQFSAALRQPTASRPGIRDVQANVSEYPAGDHRVSAMASRAAMSTRHFIRVFTQETGEAPARFVQRVRVERARQLLEESALSIEEVAQASGFGSAETLRRRFLAAVGTPPSEYRARFTRTSGADISG